MEEIKNKKWINVLERGIINDGTEDVGAKLQDIISKKETEFSVLYFPKGKYLFKTGITINTEITLLGDSDSSTSATEFITHGVPNMSIITLTGRKQCIKNISFYSDSCEVLTNDEPPTKGNPHYHYEMIINKNNKNEEMKNVSAITYVDSDLIEGLGHYENLYITGFSGTGIQIPYYSIVNDITVSSCGIGMDVGVDTIISNSRVSKCQNGMEITIGTSINNVKIEKIQKVGLKCKGGGSYKINNITIDQCGHCGFSFNLIIDSYISGIIRRCGQYYYNTDYDTYLGMEDRKEDAYSLFYGNFFGNIPNDKPGSNPNKPGSNPNKAHINYVNLISDNKDNWDDGLEYKHKVYVFKTTNMPHAILKCNIDAYDYIIETKNGGGNLRLQNNFNDYIFVNTSTPYKINGVNLTWEMDENMLRLYRGKLYFKSEGKESNLFIPNYGLIVKSTDSDISQIKSTYGSDWVKLGSKIIGKDTVYYYKHSS